MDKDEFQAISSVIDGRLDAMGTEGATHMVRMFEMISASFAKETDRPSILIHGVGTQMIVLSVNVDMLETVEMLANAYSNLHDTFIDGRPEQGDMH
jgi:hypothetical protein